jgi:hypothetical protein
MFQEKKKEKDRHQTVLDHETIECGLIIHLNMAKVVGRQDYGIDKPKIVTKIKILLIFLVGNGEGCW